MVYCLICPLVYSSIYSLVYDLVHIVVYGLPEYDFVPSMIRYNALIHLVTRHGIVECICHYLLALILTADDSDRIIDFVFLTQPSPKRSE